MADVTTAPDQQPPAGPLAGVQVVELASIGPGPFCAMLLADMGADVIRVDRLSDVGRDEPGPRGADILARGRRSIAVDLKHRSGVEVVRQLVARADALIEGFRPGVTERLGIGPDACRDLNPRLVYGRMTGFGQTGPLALDAGHDIDYIALAGALWPIGREGSAPVPPLNLVGDFGGGGMLLAFGLACALVEAKRSGSGQVVDAAMIDGAALLTAELHAERAMGLWRDERGVNRLDTGAPYYDVYECADGEYVAVGPLEAKFYEVLLERLGLDPANQPQQYDRSQWPLLRERLSDAIGSRTRDEICLMMEGSDACVAPVLSPAEAPRHPHNVARATFVERYGVAQPAPAPRFSRTPGQIRRPPCRPGEHTDEVLGDLLGWTSGEIAQARTLRAVA